MDEDQPVIRLRRPPPAKVGEDLYRITEDLDFIKAQLAQVPTVKKLCRFGVWVALRLRVLALIGLRMWTSWVWACSPL